MSRSSLDRKAFEILVRQFHKRLLAYALTLDRRADWAEDLVQEAFIVAYRKLEGFDASRDFGAWMRGIIRMKCLEYRKEKNKVMLSKAVLDALEADYSNWDRAMEEGTGEPLHALRRCLESLKGPFRSIVDKFYFERLSCLDVARQLGLTEVAVKKRLQRSRGHLEDCVNRKLGLASGAPQ